VGSNGADEIGVGRIAVEDVGVDDIEEDDMVLNGCAERLLSICCALA
jgi:hypothetical protein